METHASPESTEPAIQELEHYWDIDQAANFLGCSRFLSDPRYCIRHNRQRPESISADSKFLCSRPTSGWPTVWPVTQAWFECFASAGVYAPVTMIPNSCAGRDPIKRLQE